MRQSTEDIPTPNRGSMPLPDEAINNGERPATADKDAVKDEIVPPDNAVDVPPQGITSDNNGEKYLKEGANIEDMPDAQEDEEAIREMRGKKDA